MKAVRQVIGGLGNLMFKQAYLMNEVLEGRIPDVYVQGEHYWKQHADQIRAAYSGGITPNTKVGVHIRRGDYLPLHGRFYVDLWQTPYYQQAISLFPGREFIIFCKDNQGWEQDKADRQWCRDNIGPLIEKVGGTWDLPPKDSTEEEDLNLMAGCADLIMANSSFSWWGAYLGTHTQVICPRQWFSDGQQRTELLSQWTLL